MALTIREKNEQFENDYLSPFAAKSALTKGRKKPCDKCLIRTDFQRDRDRIIHSRAFRRLIDKTQVFINPTSDQRTRLTHTLEVAQISRTISRGLSLNEDLTEAIALGHDLGHTPFGHMGEAVLDKLVEGGFQHNKQSVRVVSLLENEGKGLNLTYEVLDGILNHRRGLLPQTLEGKVVQLSDKIAYVNHDIDDSIRMGIISSADLPKNSDKILGKTQRERIGSLVSNVIYSSLEKGDILLEAEYNEALQTLIKFMFEKVYNSPRLTGERINADEIIKTLYTHFVKNPNKMDEAFFVMYKSGKKLDRTVCDFIACMTDSVALKKYKEI